MTRLEGLQALYDAVKAGGEQPTLEDEAKSFYEGALWPHMPSGEFRSNEMRWILQAYNGSVGAALAFIAATLPGWDWMLSSDGLAEIWPRKGMDNVEDFVQEKPATALLLAGLAALIAEEKAK